MGFLPANFQLATPFHSRLIAMHGTDRRTDRRRPSTLNAPIYGDGHNNICILVLLPTLPEIWLPKRLRILFTWLHATHVEFAALNLICGFQLPPCPEKNALSPAVWCGCLLEQPVTSVCFTDMHSMHGVQVAFCQLVIKRIQCMIMTMTMTMMMMVIMTQFSLTPKETRASSNLVHCFIVNILWHYAQETKTNYRTTLHWRLLAS